MNGHPIKLKDLHIEEQATIVGYENNDEVALHRLLTLGLTKNATVVLKQIAPLGDPVKVGVRGFDLSLRKDEADSLILMKL
ncbi:FeoA family protein [Entomospira nematocerorum]|uniref:Ferrous iron transport protein A n=1 Tax=Entomospira nematocerorum TaxID=2719987 RepID=A0A968GAQ8_9SPIO|nr:FeoA family protein [Entomospira nematocera]NIZ46430.1 ferrous iron transport protein A [Entomospira nematocera]WDI33767.1 FeoA family protein [Entomospira nematocera]